MTVGKHHDLDVCSMIVCSECCGCDQYDKAIDQCIEILNNTLGGYGYIRDMLEDLKAGDRYRNEN